MELRHIRYFLAVAEEKNFTRAAMRVGIGQPPLSQQIKDLEVEIGAPLFHRVPQGAELTEAGSAFFQAVQDVPGQVERAIRAAQQAARGEVGSIRIGFTGSAAFHPDVAAAVRSFRAAYPAVDLTLDEGSTTDLVSGLTEGTLDGAFIRPSPDQASIEKLHFRVISQERLMAVLPTRHPAARDGKVDLACLKDDLFILTPRHAVSTLFDMVMAACRSAGFEPVLGQSAPRPSSAINLVAAELGVSIVPASMQMLRLPGVVYSEILGETPVIRLALATRRSDPSRIVRNFITCAVADDFGSRPLEAGAD